MSNSTTIKGSVEQQFSPVAANYVTSPVHATGIDLPYLVNIAALNGSQRVLDAGCGPGHTALAVAPHAREVVALDLSNAMLAEGKRLAAERGLANVEFRQGNVEHLPFDNGSFDRVVSRYSAHHWPNPRAALAEFRRVLKHRPGAPGVVVLADVVSYPEFTLDTFLQTVELLRDPSHVRDHTVDGWLGMFDDAGFDTKVAHRWDLRLDFPSWVERMATPPAAVAMIRTLLANAPQEVRTAFKVEPDSSFVVRGAIFHAVPRGE
jgi:ubiquinone/menaquinone biosynthesis C-methylase UbiE